MRIHKNIKISRRQDIKSGKPYRSYLKNLREDFGYICGYCGKSELVTKNTFEIDHFIPKRLAPERENDYSNLVYACYECNRKKAGKWPSENKDIQIFNGLGFVDPATEEYDNHLERSDAGDIVGKTITGKYMVEDGFEFNKRPIKEIYKAMLLIEKKHELEKKMKFLSGDEKQEYIEFSMVLEKLQMFLFDYKE